MSDEPQNLLGTRFEKVLIPIEAQLRLELGAKLVQLFTGLIYRGPGLVNAIAHEVQRRLHERRPAVLAYDVGKPPDVTQADRRSGRGQDEPGF